MLSILDKKAEQNEKLIMEELLSCIKCKKSLVFNAGAGAGKTYALVECLKYICKEKAEILNYHNQKIICITYTNVAANEIKRRLGNTDLMLISTIHERLWEIIKDYQEELLLIHRDHLRKQIVELKQEVVKNDVYAALTKEQKEEISMSLMEHQKEFYKICAYKAKDFKEQFYAIFPFFKSKISNAEKFSKTCSKIIRIRKYEQCILSVEKGEDGYTQVKYDARNNKDCLHHMKISHDTLLLYSYQIICKYNALKRFIIDKYPYFFVDEYQDTNEMVVSILTEIENYSKQINHPVFIGYYGDTVQNIYDAGIGIKIENYCKEYKHINKIYNYRSCNEIIVLSNKIRHDDIQQQSVYKDSEGGSVKVYYGTEDDIEDFIYVNSFEMKEKSIKDKTVHCFLLYNKVVAEHAGLTELYEWFKNAPFYKRNYDILTTELLSNDINKLGEIERYLYNITEFFFRCQREDTPLLDIVPGELLVALDIESVSEIVNALKRIRGNSLKEIIEAIEKFKNNLSFILMEKRDRKIIDKTIEAITGIENFSMKNFIDTVKYILFQNVVTSEEQINVLLDLDREILYRWYQYINRDYESDVIYHTFHSTKGLEFNNVIMIFGDSFGRNKSYFNDYFTDYNQELEDDNLEQYRKGRNLLYVAATRARMNLRILYTGDYQNKKEIFDMIFGDVRQWKNE